MNDLDPGSVESPHWRKQRVVRFVTHLVALAFLLFLPEVLMMKSVPRRGDVPMWIFYIKPFLYCLAFYANYYFIIDRSFGRRFGVWRFVLQNLVVFIAMFWVFWGISRFMPGPGRFSIVHEMSFFLRDCVMLALVIALAVALKMSDRWLRLDRRRQEMAVTRREEELKSLKSQLNPHFLFNTLNSIYALISISPDIARQAVHDLSSLLRYVLYEDGMTVKLSQELAFIGNYVRLMRLRLGDDVPVEVTLDPGRYADRQVPPLLFISLVENAFKHGQPGAGRHPVVISIVCDGDMLSCHISNGYDPNAVSPDTSGIGIANLRRRLDLIYGASASMHTSASDGVYTVDMIINLNGNSI